MARLRFKLRWLMVAVAVVALGVWGERMRRASSAYREQAEFYRYLLTTPRNNPSTSEGASVAEKSLDIATEVARERRLMHYIEAMLAKYEHAARRPWLPVEPDPPEPE